MKKLGALLIGVFLAGISTGCSKHACSTTVNITTTGTVANGNPPSVEVSDKQLNADKCWPYYTIRWKAKGSWWVEFQGAYTPCGKDFVLEKGRTEVCTIDASQVPIGTFKYWLLDDNTVSQDPQVVHDDTKGATATLAGSSGPVSPPTRFCLDLTRGTPVPCNSTDPPQLPQQTAEPLAPAHPLDVIRWQGSSGWSVTFGNNTPCVEADPINEAQRYCTINPSAVASCTNATPCTYPYTVQGGSTYHVKVYPAPSRDK